MQTSASVLAWVRREFRHASGGWLAAIMVSPVFLSFVAALLRPVRRHHTVIAVAFAAFATGSAVTVLLLHRSLWPRRTSPPIEPVSPRRIAGALGGLLACSLVVLGMGWAMPVGPKTVAARNDAVERTQSPEPAADDETGTESPPDVVPTTTPPPTTPTAVPEKLRPISLPPEKLDAIRLIEADVGRVTDPIYVSPDGGRGAELFDPLGIVLCTGLSLSPRPVTLSTNNMFRGYDSRFGSEATLYATVADARATMQEIADNLAGCSYNTRSGRRLGEETLRFWTTDEGGDYVDHIIFRLRNLVVQVGSTNGAGNHATPADALADVCARNVGRVLR